jgi:hypothetical protein
MSERIVAAAIVQPDGIVYVVPRPGRHHHVLHHMNGRGNTHDTYRSQGFITSDGEFVDRDAAMRIAATSGQLIRPVQGRTFLMSEDVW